MLALEHCYRTEQDGPDQAQTYLVVRIRHRVERSDCQGIFVQHIEVSIILWRTQQTGT